MHSGNHPSTRVAPVRWTAAHSVHARIAYALLLSDRGTRLNARLLANGARASQEAVRTKHDARCSLIRDALLPCQTSWQVMHFFRNYYNMHKKMTTFWSGIKWARRNQGHPNPMRARGRKLLDKPRTNRVQSGKYRSTLHDIRVASYRLHSTR